MSVCLVSIIQNALYHLLWFYGIFLFLEIINEKIMIKNEKDSVCGGVGAQGLSSNLGIWSKAVENT